MACGLETINWSAPWLSPWREIGEPLAEPINSGQSVAQALNSHTGSPVRFVPQTELPAGVAYEQHVFSSASVPTRDEAHDFFNGLCWLRFPQTKQRLNQLQAQQIAISGIGRVRGPQRDALTIFDENAAFFWAPELLWNALRTRNWHRLFVELRPLWAQARLILFGHALLEKLLQPRIAITAHVYRVLASGLADEMKDADAVQPIDAWVAQDLTIEKLLTKPFAPLPVLGVPGWWLPNESPDFYEDKTVFRPPAIKN